MRDARARGCEDDDEHGEEDGDDDDDAEDEDFVGPVPRLEDYRCALGSSSSIPSISRRSVRRPFSRDDVALERQQRLLVGSSRESHSARCYSPAPTGLSDGQQEEGEEEEELQAPLPLEGSPPPPSEGDGAGGSSDDAGLCWLCTFSTHPLARQIERFINSTISTMDVSHVAVQSRHEIVEAFPQAKGVELRDVRKHISEHMLSPQVVFAFFQ